MSTLVSFPLNNAAGTKIVDLVPTNNANGVAEWSNPAASRSQRYVVTASARNGNQTRKYTVKISVPKVETQTVNGVDLPVTAWRGHISVDVSVPVYASQDDVKLITAALASVFANTAPIREAIELGAGFY